MIIFGYNVTQLDLLFIMIILIFLFNLVTFLMTRLQISMIIHDVENSLDCKIGNYLADESFKDDSTCTDCSFFTEIGTCTLGDISAYPYQNACKKFYALDSPLGERIALSIAKLGKEIATSIANQNTNYNYGLACTDEECPGNKDMTCRTKEPCIRPF